MRNPESDEAKELVQRATDDEKRDAEDLKAPVVLPWWETPDTMEEGEEEKTALCPEMVEEAVLEGIRPPNGTGGKLAFNAIAIWRVPISAISNNNDSYYD